MSEQERNPLIELLAREMADAAKERGDSWYFDEMTGETFLGWDDLSDEDMDVGYDHWVKGRDYYRDQARVALAWLRLDDIEVKPWATRIEVESKAEVVKDEAGDWHALPNRERIVTWHRYGGGLPQVTWRDAS